LRVDGLVEAILLADLLQHGWITLLAGHGERRIAGEQLLQPEDDHRDEKQRRDQLQQALGQEWEHVALNPIASRIPLPLTGRG
jgi:hypothetical protein